MRSQLFDTTSQWLQRDYGMEVAQEYEDRFLVTDGQSYGVGHPVVEDLPANLNFNAGVEFINQVISYDRILFWGYISDMIRAGGSPDSQGNMKNAPSIAFGRRVVDKPVVQLKERLDTALRQKSSGGSPQASQYDRSRLQILAKDSVQERFSISPQRNLPLSLEQQDSPNRKLRMLQNVSGGGASRFNDQANNAAAADMEVRVMGQGHTGESPLRAKKPAHYEVDEG